MAKYSFSMKKRISIVLIAAFLSIITINANAAIKAGTTCKKLGLTSMFVGKKYTCVKSGKKLVWNKGVETSKSLPSNSVTPAQTPSLSIDKFKEQAPAVPITFESLKQNLSGIIHAAWLKGFMSINGKSFAIGNLHLLVGPNSTLNEQDKNYLTSITNVQRLFSGIPQSKNVYLIYYSSRDIAWAQNQFEKYMDAYYGYGSRSSAAIDNCPEPNCNGGMAVHTSNFDTIILMGDNNGWKWETFSPSQGYYGHVFAHEYTHTIQLANMNPNWGNFPHWLTEGAAEWAATTAVTYESYSNYTNYREKVVLGMQYGNSSTYNKDYLTKFLNPNLVFDQGENIGSYNHGFPRWDSYSIGFMTCEILVALKDQNILISLLQDINKGMTFAEAFESEFGTKWSTAAPLIVDAIDSEIRLNIKS
jgi:hypothetical protein